MEMASFSITILASSLQCLLTFDVDSSVGGQATTQLSGQQREGRTSYKISLLAIPSLVPDNHLFIQEVSCLE